MSITNNWFKVAQVAEQPSQPTMPNSNTTENASVPEPSSIINNGPDTPQNSQVKPQDIKNMQVREMSIADVANKALPVLNTSLDNLSRELLLHNEMQLTEQSSRTLAIEMMAAWLAESRKGKVSELASIAMQSQRINAVLDTL